MGEGVNSQNAAQIWCESGVGEIRGYCKVWRGALFHLVWAGGGITPFHNALDVHISISYLYRQALRSAVQAAKQREEAARFPTQFTCTYKLTWSLMSDSIFPCQALWLFDPPTTCVGHRNIFWKRRVFIFLQKFFGFLSLRRHARTRIARALSYTHAHTHTQRESVMM